MTVYANNQLLPLVGAACYMLLLLTPFMRQGESSPARKWLVGVIAASIVWEFSLLLAPNLPDANFAATFLLLSTLFVGATTAVYIDWQISRAVKLLIAIAIVLVFLIALAVPRASISLGILPQTDGALISYLVWFALSGLILIKAWRQYQATAFPWHANRLLYWCVVLVAVFLGEMLQFIDVPPLIIIGQFLRFVGVVGMAYGIASFRIFDVRTRALRTIAFLIINTISVLPLIISVLLALQISSEFELRPGLITAVTLTVIITIGFFLYQPYRRVVERVTFRYIRGESLNTNQVMRQYSQAISRTLDVQQLSLLISGTFSELLETNRCGLMLLTPLSDGRSEIEPVPGMGHFNRENHCFAPDDLFIITLARQNQPLLQYELDFNPDYQELSDPARTWIKAQAMEVFVPVGRDAEMEGIIAVGPKVSAVPYQPGELEMMQILADQTVVALQNARLYSELNEQNERISHLNTDLIEQNERLEIMDRVKSDFITIASHELRTPLTQVKGYSDILDAMNDESALTREQTREIIGHINRATLQLEGLITAMLDTSQLDVDGMQLTFVKTQIETILRLATEPMAHALRERRIDLISDGIDELPPIYGDFKRLVQSFTNLMGNAVKYTPDHGRIQVQGITLASVAEEEFIEVIISDSGIGIDPQYHELIFEKFFRIGDPQLHSTGSTKFKGAGPGLGLPIAKGVIEAHGGRIWVESDGEDEARLPGSHFHILLPVRPPGADIAEPLPDAEQPVYLIG